MLRAIDVHPRFSPKSSIRLRVIRKLAECSFAYAPTLAGSCHSPRARTMAAAQLRRKPVDSQRRPLLWATAARQRQAALRAQRRNSTRLQQSRFDHRTFPHRIWRTSIYDEDDVATWTFAVRVRVRLRD